ncbi:MucBP domain-containing protein [Periweissella fabalis]
MHFKTANGKMLAPDIVLTGFIGDSYQADMPKITGYTPVLANSVITGLFKLPKEEQTVVYQPITTDININYLDQNGQQLAPKKVISGEFGTTYQLQPIILPGYEYIANSANLTGNFEANTTNISLSYQRLIGHVEVVFLTNHHHPLLPRKVVSGYFGDNYRIEIPNVKGFTSNIKALTGTFDDKTRQIIVTYTPIPIKPVTVNLHIINQQNDQVVRIITLQGKVGERIMFNKAFYMKLLAQYGLKPVDLQTWPKVFVINNDTPAESVLSFMVVPVDKQIPMPTDIINKGQTLADSERSNKAILQKNYTDKDVVSFDVNNLIQSMIPTTDQQVDAVNTKQHSKVKAFLNDVKPSTNQTKGYTPSTQAYQRKQVNNKQKAKEARFIIIKKIIKEIRSKIGFSKSDQAVKKMPVNSPSPSAILTKIETPNGGGSGNGQSTIGAIMGALATSTSFGAR